MEHFAIHKLSKTHTSLLSKVSDRLCCDNSNSVTSFYHSDHLGSASWITNGSGTPVQHLQYMPYGEPFVNERKSSYEERFTFTGKERDSETGFSYFGARYYDSDLMTGWLSVDPMSDKYPNISPYAYCAWNPIKLVDPDGRDGVLKVDGKNLTVQLIINYNEKTIEKAQKIGVCYETLVNDVNNYLVSKSGIYNICGTDYNVKFDISFNKVNEFSTDIEYSYGEINLIFGPSKNSANHLKNVITISSPLRNYEKNDLMGTLSHEILHTLGLKDSKNSGWLSSYDLNRKLHPEEVAIMLGPCVDIINKENITNGEITIPRSKRLTNGTHVRDNPHKID